MKFEKLIGIFGLIGLFGLLALVPVTTNSRVYGSGSGGGHHSGGSSSSHMSKFHSRHQATSSCDSPADKAAILACCVNGVGIGSRSQVSAYFKKVGRALQAREPYTIDLFWNALECIGDGLDMILSGDFRFPPACCKIEIFNQIKALCPYQSKHRSPPSRSKFDDDY